MGQDTPAVTESPRPEEIDGHRGRAPLHDPVPSRWPIIAAIGVGLSSDRPRRERPRLEGRATGADRRGLLIALNGAGRWWSELLRDKFFGRDAAEADSRLKRMFAFFIASEASDLRRFLRGAVFARHHAKMLAAGGNAALRDPPARDKHRPPVRAASTLHLAHVGAGAGPEGRDDRRAAHDDLSRRALPLRPGVRVRLPERTPRSTSTSGIFGTTFFMLTGFHGLHVRGRDHLPERGLRRGDPESP